MKNLILNLVFLLSVLSFSSCSNSDNTTLSAENFITDFLVEGHEVAFNKEENKVVIKVEPSSYDTRFKYQIVGLAPKASTSIPVEGEMSITSNSTSFTIYAENGDRRRIEIQIVQKDGIISANIVNSENYQVTNRLLIKEDTIDILVDKDLIQSFFPLVSYTFTFTTTPGSYVKEITDVIVGADTPFTITYVRQDGSEKQYTVAFKNTRIRLSYFVMPAVTFQTNINYYPHIASLQVNSRSSTTIPEKYTQGLEPLDHIFLTLETEKEAFKHVKPLILRTNYKSTISPGIDEARDFTQDVVYTITSESGTPKEIKIRTFFEKFITSLPIQYISIEKNNRMMFRYYAISPIKEVKLINTKTAEVVKTTVIDHTTLNETSLYQLWLRVDQQAPDTVFDMEITLENNDVISKPIQQVSTR